MVAALKDPVGAQRPPSLAAAPLCSSSSEALSLVRLLGVFLVCGVCCRVLRLDVGDAAAVACGASVDGGESWRAVNARNDPEAIAVG